MGVGIQGMRERVRQLGGKLEITSKPNEGTLVTATIPLAESQKAAEDMAAAAMGASGSRIAAVTQQKRGTQERVPANASPAAMAAAGALRKQILIADDHEMIRRGLRTMLEKEENWQICGEAINGREVVDKASELRPDLIILDINMPVLNGLAAVRQILRNTPQTKILVFTVHDSDQMMSEALAAGAHGYLSKSNANADLLRVVKNLLESGPAGSRATPPAPAAPPPLQHRLN